MRLVPILVLVAACGGADATKGDKDTSGDTDTASTDTPAVEPTCDDPGTPTTATPAVSTDANGRNVEALACTQTATALACDLGVGHAYAESIADGRRSITANGIVNHDVGTFPNPDNPNAIAAQAYTYSVPVTPSGTGSSQQGVFGVLFSGAVLDPATAELWNDDESWRYEALRYATAADHFDSDATNHPTGLGVDCNLAHVQPGGAYHYHGVPTSLLPATPAVTQVGWAADGAPIVALYGHEDGTDAASPVRALTTSYQLRTGTRPAGAPSGAYDGTFVADWAYVDGLGDLDACNGRIETLTLDGVVTTTYVYVLTETYPYIPRCFTYTPDPSFLRVAPGGGSGGGPGGGAPADCAPGQTSMCCGDGVCDGPETAETCPADCP
ncbi:MAG: hypothetical protein RLZZ383_3019 [Pseudomonadota bacterium]